MGALWETAHYKLPTSKGLRAISCARAQCMLAELSFRNPTLASQSEFVVRDIEMRLGCTYPSEQSRPDGSCDV